MHQQMRLKSPSIKRRNCLSPDTPTTALLSAKQANQQALINLVQARSNRYVDTAALFKFSVLVGGTLPKFPKSMKASHVTVL